MNKAELINMAFAALRIAAAVYLGLSVLLFFRQSGLVYFPLKKVLLTPADAALRYEAVTLLTSDGVQLASWYVPRESARGTVLICHGNGGNIGDRLHVIGLCHELGLNVLIFDYRGYGESAGKPTEAGTYRDALAAWQYLTENRKTPPDKIVVFGRSLGGAVAAELAARVVPAALIIEAAFTSIPELGQRLYPYLPVRFLCRFRYNTREYLQSVNCPVLIAHSREDEMIPFAHGRKLYAAARPPKTFVELIGDHNAGEALTSPGYRQALDKFFTDHLGAPSPASP